MRRGSSPAPRSTLHKKIFTAVVAFVDVLEAKEVGPVEVASGVVLCGVVQTAPASAAQQILQSCQDINVFDATVHIGAISKFGDVSVQF